jgi:hypothetical protein
MATKVLDALSDRRYWPMTRRSLIDMVARRALHLVTGSASGLLVRPFVRPFVVMAARALGPGPTRLKMVKLAHNLGTPGARLEPFVEEQAPTQRAA